MSSKLAQEQGKQSEIKSEMLIKKEKSPQYAYSQKGETISNDDLQKSLTNPQKSKRKGKSSSSESEQGSSSGSNSNSDKQLQNKRSSTAFGTLSQPLVKTQQDDESSVMPSRNSKSIIQSREKSKKYNRKEAYSAIRQNSVIMKEMEIAIKEKLRKEPKQKKKKKQSKRQQSSDYEVEHASKEREAKLVKQIAKSILQKRINADSKAYYKNIKKRPVTECPSEISRNTRSQTNQKLMPEFIKEVRPKPDKKRNKKQQNKSRQKRCSRNSYGKHKIIEKEVSSLQSSESQQITQQDEPTQIRPSSTEKARNVTFQGNQGSQNISKASQTNNNATQQSLQSSRSSQSKESLSQRPEQTQEVALKDNGPEIYAYINDPQSGAIPSIEFIKQQLQGMKIDEIKQSQLCQFIRQSKIKQTQLQNLRLDLEQKLQESSLEYDKLIEERNQEKNKFIKDICS